MREWWIWRYGVIIESFVKSLVMTEKCGSVVAAVRIEYLRNVVEKKISYVIFELINAILNNKSDCGYFWDRLVSISLKYLQTLQFTKKIMKGEMTYTLFWNVQLKCLLFDQIFIINLPCKINIISRYRKECRLYLHELVLT